jgi:hypothetical protein
MTVTATVIIQTGTVTPKGNMVTISTLPHPVVVLREQLAEDVSHDGVVLGP